MLRVPCQIPGPSTMSTILTLRRGSEILWRGGHIADGDVVECSIEDMRPSDLAGYTQFHAFAGIGGWSLALRLAGVPDSYPIWTGSCPCQPFSAAGKGGGTADERHLWPAFFHLIDQCRPGVVLGEQVASSDGLGWLDLVSADMEGAGYAFAAHDLCAAGVGAPHIRQRLWFVGYTHGERQGAFGGIRQGTGAELTGGRAVGGVGYAGGDHMGRLHRGASRQETESQGSGQFPRNRGVVPGSASAVGELADTLFAGWTERRTGAGGGSSTGSGLPSPLADTDQGGCGIVGGDGLRRQQFHDVDGCREGFRVADPDGGSSGRDAGRLHAQEAPAWGVRIADGFEPSGAILPRSPAARTIDQPWRDADWLFCRDGKWRPVEPGSFPLVDGLPTGMVALGAELERLATLVGLDGGSLKRAKGFRAPALRGFGNAIVTSAAEAHIRAVMAVLANA